MAQAAVNSVPHEHAPPSKAKQEPFLSSGRGGSGNIRRLNTSNNGEPPPDLPVLPPRERQGTSKGNKVQPSFRPARLELPTESHGLEQKQFTSSGRGGSGNVKLSTSSLEAHPVTASILSQHSAVQAQYEQRMREAHAESKVVRSSGRGGSGNITDPRQRSHSQEPRIVSKKRFFTRKGREAGTTSIDGDSDRRTSTTCSSGSSMAFDARRSGGIYVSNAGTSSTDVTVNVDPSPSEDAMPGYSRKGRKYLTSWGIPPPSTSPVAPPRSPCPSSSTVPTYPGSRSTGSSGTSLRAYSSTSVVLEEPDSPEYVSFLEM